LLRTLDGSIIPRVVANSGTRALLSMSEFAGQTGRPLSDPSLNFSEVMLYGSLSGQDLLGVYGITYMQDNTFQDQMEHIINLSWEAFKINLSYNLTTNFSLIQDNGTGPWHIRVNFNITLLLNATIMDWNTTRNLSVLIPIEGIPDPYYSMNFRTFDYRPVIMRAPVTIGNWTVASYITHVRNVSYFEDTHAPSFIVRLQNRTTPVECCGIESMINAADYAMDLPVPRQNWTYADHCFYGHDCNASRPGEKSLWNVSGITGYVQGGEFYGMILTQYHIGKYNLTSLESRQVVVKP